MRLKSCCFCVNDLEKASKIIAIVHIVLGVVITAYSWISPNLGNLVSGVITILLGCILLVGVSKKSTTAIKVYMVITVISIIIYVIAAVFTIGVLIVQLNATIRYKVRFYRLDYMIMAVCIAAAMSALSIGLSFYFLMVVYSYYSALQDEEHQPIGEEASH